MELTTFGFGPNVPAVLLARKPLADRPMVFRPVAHNRTADAIVAQIEALILDGVLRPGDRLPPERDLCRMLDVSRPILREALDDLSRRVLVESRHGGGTYVADVIGEVFRQPVVDLVRAHPRHRPTIWSSAANSTSWPPARGPSVRPTTTAPCWRPSWTSLTRRTRQPTFAGSRTRRRVPHGDLGQRAQRDPDPHVPRLLQAAPGRGIYNRALLYDRDDCRDRLIAQHRAIAAAILAGDGRRRERRGGAYRLRRHRSDRATEGRGAGDGLGAAPGRRRSPARRAARRPCAAVGLGDALSGRKGTG